LLLRSHCPAILPRTCRNVFDQQMGSYRSIVPAIQYALQFWRSSLLSNRFSFTIHFEKWKVRFISKSENWCAQFLVYTEVCANRAKRVRLACGRCTCRQERCVWSSSMFLKCNDRCPSNRSPTHSSSANEELKSNTNGEYQECLCADSLNAR
jgi:hypothetical protein